MEPTRFEIGDVVLTKYNNLASVQGGKIGVVVDWRYAARSSSSSIIYVRLLGLTYDLGFLSSDLDKVTNKRKAARVLAALAFGLE